AVRELRARDRVERGVHRAGDPADRAGGPQDEAVRGFLVELVRLELRIEERDDVLDRDAHFTRSAMMRFRTALFARPPIFFITGPTRPEIARWFPARMSATTFGFAAMASSTAAAMAASSDTWDRPFSATIASASRPVASISVKTVFAAVVLIVPAAMSRTSAPSGAGVAMTCASGRSTALRWPSISPVTQSATRFACAGAAA